MTDLPGVQAFVRDHPRVRARGGGTKPALWASPGDAAVLDVSGLTGVVDYEPSEYTFTALAGTRVSEVDARLAAHGQALPFDPPLSARGATLGGTVASGLSGPGRQRHGGVRDFLLAVQWVDGEGRVLRGGAKVVKNAAGFDLPKLMAGSLGRLGVVVELTFKVFPRPEASVTLVRETSSIDEACEVVRRLLGTAWDLDAVDIVPRDGGGASLFVRIAGLARALFPRIDRLRGAAGGGEVLEGPSDSAAWDDAREMTWVPEGAALVKVPLTLGRLARLDEQLRDAGTARRYSVGGQVAWVAWPGALNRLTAILDQAGLRGLVLWGDSEVPVIGSVEGEAFAGRVKQALDPWNRFGPCW